MTTALRALVLLVLFAAPVTAQQLPAAVCDSLKASRKTMSTPPTKGEEAAALNRAAWAGRSQGFGLSRKPSGNSCPGPGGPIACDVVGVRTSNANLPMTYWDVWTEDAALVVRCGSAAGTITAAGRDWVAPVDPGGSTPPPVDPPPSNDLTARVVALERTTALQTAQLSNLQNQVTALTVRVASLEHAPTPPTGCTPTLVSTSREWGHAHTVLGCK